MRALSEILTPEDMAALVDGSLGGLVVVSTADGRVVSCNQAFRAFAGTEAASMEGKTFREHLGATHLGGRATGSDGAAVSWSYRDITGRDGNSYRLAIGRLASPGELSERLDEREAILRAIFETVPGALITIDEQGTIRSFSRGAERMFDYSAGEVVGQNISILMPSPYRDEHDRYIMNYLRTGQKKIIGIGRVVVAQRKDGSTFPIELAVGEAKTPEGHLFVGAIRDLTMREQAERQIHQLQTSLLQASRQSIMGEMSSALAHELNQPISAIMSYVDAAQHLLTAPSNHTLPRVRDMLAKAAMQSRRAGQIVHHLRHYVLTGETEKSEEDLNVVIQDSLAMALVGTSSREVNVQLSLAADLSKALIDRVQIQQVVVNLIRNALEAVAGLEKPVLTIATASHDDGFLKVTVADSGKGIDPEIADRLFLPFVTTKPKGMGVGLSICRSIIDNHGGRIWVESSPLGGAAFAFTVPVAADR